MTCCCPAARPSRAWPVLSSASRCPPLPLRNPAPHERSAPGLRPRRILAQAAAERGGAPRGGITVERSVLPPPRGRRGGSGQFAEAAARRPVPADAPLKPPSAFRLIGQDGAVRRLERCVGGNR